MRRNFILLTIFMIFGSMLYGQSGNHWDADESLYPNNMTITAVVLIDDIDQITADIEIGAFCGEELRGNNRLKYEGAPLDRYFLYLTICGNDGDIINFRLYNHETQAEFDALSNETITFITNDNLGSIIEPYVLTFTTPTSAITFTGSGSWNESSNWLNSIMPTATDDVTIDGDAFISEEVTINSLVINEGKSITIQNGGILSVASTLTNEDYDALIIEDGGQIIQTNDDVAATFKKNIENPSEQWGELDKTGWHFVSSPMQNSKVSDFAPESGDYDLYMYDGTLENEWYNFKKTTSYSFDGGMENWTSTDADGDGYGWYYSESDGYLYSESYTEDGDELTPENYLVSPLLDIDNVGTIFRFKVASLDDMYMDYCGVFVSEDNGLTFNPIEGQSWWIGEGVDESNPSDWYEKEIDLTAYSGKKINVAICHYNMNDGAGFQLLIDDIEFGRDGMFESGIAYLASYETETTAEFQGFLNNNNSYKINATYNASEAMTNYNLFGNPFSYNIDWATDVKLIGVNAGYAKIKSDGGYEYKTDGIIKVGEGFMINSAKGRSHNITFQKGINASKRSIDNNSINVIATGKFGTDNVILSFNENKTSAFPKLVNFNDKIANVYVKENDTVFAIFNYEEEVKEIPLYFDAKEMGVYTLTFDVKGNSENLYLIDKMTGEKVDLLLENEYSFMANSNDNPERFVLIMDNSQQTTDNSHFAYINNGNIVIFDIEGDAQIRIVDALGRCIYNGECSDEIHRVDAASHVPTSGIYIIEKIDDKGIKVQKMIL